MIDSYRFAAVALSGHRFALQKSNSIAEFVDETIYRQIAENLGRSKKLGTHTTILLAPEMSFLAKRQLLELATESTTSTDIHVINGAAKVQAVQIVNFLKCMARLAAFMVR